MSDLFAARLGRQTGADFSECRKWRYALWRWWDTSKPHATFVLMNPSTANEIDNDPTVERCELRLGKWQSMGWWDLGGVKVVNAFAWRETDSKLLRPLVRAGVDIIGMRNDVAILAACAGAAVVVCGWGSPGHILLDRGRKVLDLLRGAGITPHVFKMNDDGSPKHPLYVGYDVKPVPWICSPPSEETTA